MKVGKVIFKFLHIVIWVITTLLLVLTLCFFVLECNGTFSQPVPKQVEVIAVNNGSVTEFAVADKDHIYICNDTDSLAIGDSVEMYIQNGKAYTDASAFEQIASVENNIVKWASITAGVLVGLYLLVSFIETKYSKKQADSAS